MNKNIVSKAIDINQDLIDQKQSRMIMDDFLGIKDTFKIRQSFKKFIQNLIREYRSDYDDYNVDVKDFAIHDQKIMLAYILDDEEYFEEVCANNFLLLAELKENLPVMQKLVEEEMETVFCEDMHNMDCYCTIDPINGEPTWHRR